MIVYKIAKLGIILSLMTGYNEAYGSNSGVLPTVNEDGEVWVMVGLEERKQKTCWTDFGGKINAGEKPKSTAVRELKEETAGCVELSIDALSDYMYLRLWGYHAYFVDIGSKLPTWNIKKHKDTPLNGVHKKHVEKKDWLWIKARDFFEMVYDGKRVKRHKDDYTLYDTSSDNGFPLFGQYRQELSRRHQDLEFIFQKLGYTKISSQISSVDEGEWKESYEKSSYDCWITPSGYGYRVNENEDWSQDRSGNFGDRLATPYLYQPFYGVMVPSVLPQPSYGAFVSPAYPFSYNYPHAYVPLQPAWPTYPN